MFALNHRYLILVSKLWVKYHIDSNSTLQFRSLMRAYFIRVDKSIPLVAALVNWFLFNSNISIEHSALCLFCPHYVGFRWNTFSVELFINPVALILVYPICFFNATFIHHGFRLSGLLYALIIDSRIVM